MTDVPVCGFRPGRHSSAVSSNLHSRLFTFEAPKSGRVMAEFSLTSGRVLLEFCQSSLGRAPSGAICLGSESVI